MNVLTVNHRFFGGGASAVAAGLFQALRVAGHGSRMLVGGRAPDVPDVDAIGMGLLSRFSYHLLNLCGLNYLGITNGRRVLRQRFLAEADAVHLHNIHGGYLSYGLLPRLTQRKPVVWTLHDMWALTGHCCHSLDCARWRSGCGRCPYPGTYPPVRVDATRSDWHLKRWVYARSRAVIVTPSRWLAGLVRASMLSHLPLHVVPNAVDTAVYAPRARADCRERLGLPADRQVLLFVAEHVNSPFKRFEFLPEVLRLIPAERRAGLLLLVMGGEAPGEGQVDGIPAVCLGYVSEAARKVAAYGAADLLLYPTRADNLPMVVQEALACGCPVVGEDVGGVGELVRSGVTGLLVPSGRPEAFAAGVCSLLEHASHRRGLERQCRDVAVREYGLDLHLQRMLAIYDEAIQRQRTGDWEVVGA